MQCPLCKASMFQDGKYLLCQDNNLHRIELVEYTRYIMGEVDLNYLRWRAKIRLGKAVRKK
jgi:hypothetical protein